MLTAFWDASALSKRYTKERGSDTFNVIFNHPTMSRMVFTFAGYGETHAILRRRFNGGALDREDYLAAKTFLRLEVIESLLFDLVEAEIQVFASIRLIERYNLNSTDTSILAAFLEYRTAVLPAGHKCILVVSDHRLLRAATAEGLAVVDPETLTPVEIEAFLGRF